MITLDEKKRQIFEFLDGKFWGNPDHGEWIESLNFFEWFSYSSKEGSILSTTGDWGTQPSIRAGGSYGRTLIQFSKVQQFIQKTLLRDTYIKVNDEKESKWVQGLFFKAGFKWGCNATQIKKVSPTELVCRSNGIIYYDRDRAVRAYEIESPYLETLFNTKFNKKTIKPDQKSLSDQVRKLENELIDIKYENRELKQILADIKARIN